MLINVYHKQRLNGTSATYLIRDYNRAIPIIALLSGGAKPQDVIHNHYHLVGMNDIIPSSPTRTRLLNAIKVCPMSSNGQSITKKIVSAECRNTSFTC